MLIELDRIADLIEWRVEPNRIVGSIRALGVDSSHQVTIRLEGYSVHDRLRKRVDAQVSIALAIIKDVYHDRLFNTAKLGDHQAPPDEPKPIRKASGKGSAKAPRAVQPKNKKRTGRSAG